MVHPAFSREITGADNPRACSPSNAVNASCMLPVETPFRYSHGSTASTARDRRTYRGTSPERKHAPASERSRTLGTCTVTGPMPVNTSRLGR